MTRHDEVIHAAAVSADGRWIISGSADRTLRLWDSATGQLLDTFTVDAEVRSCTLTPDAHYAGAGDASGGLHYFRLGNLPGASVT